MFSPMFALLVALATLPRATASATAVDVRDWAGFKAALADDYVPAITVVGDITGIDSVAMVTRAVAISGACTDATGAPRRCLMQSDNVQADGTTCRTKDQIYHTAFNVKPFGSTAVSFTGVELRCFYASSTGGAILVESGAFSATNVAFVENKINVGGGGGVYVGEYAESASFGACAFEGNAASTGFGQHLYLYSGRVSYQNFGGNTFDGKTEPTGDDMKGLLIWPAVSPGPPPPPSTPRMAPPPPPLGVVSTWLDFKAALFDAAVPTITVVGDITGIDSRASVTRAVAIVGDCTDTNGAPRRCKMQSDNVEADGTTCRTTDKISHWALFFDPGAGAAVSIAGVELRCFYKRNWGGAMRVESGAFSATDVGFLENEAGSGGGSAYIYDDVESASFGDCTFEGNLALDQSHGDHMILSTIPTYYNLGGNTFNGKTEPSGNDVVDGYGVMVPWPSVSPTLVTTEDMPPPPKSGGGSTPVGKKSPPPPPPPSLLAQTCESVSGFGLLGVMIACSEDFGTSMSMGGMEGQELDPPIYYNGQEYKSKEVAQAQGVAKSCSVICQGAVTSYLNSLTESCGNLEEGNDARTAVGFMLPKCSVPGITQADKKCFAYISSLKDVSTSTEAENYVYNILKKAGAGASDAALKAALEASSFSDSHRGGSCKVIDALNGWSDTSSCAPASDLCKCAEHTVEGLETLYDIAVECGNSRIMTKFELPAGTATSMSSALKLLDNEMDWLTTLDKPLDSRTAADIAGIPDMVECLRTVSCAGDKGFTGAVTDLDSSLGSACDSVKANCDAASRCRAGDGDCECMCSVFTTKVTLQGNVNAGAIADAKQALAAKFNAGVSNFAHTFEDGVLTLDYSVDIDHVEESIQTVNTVVDAQLGDADVVITQTLQQSDAGSELGDFAVTGSSQMAMKDMPEVPIIPERSESESGDMDFFSTGGGYAVIGLIAVAGLGMAVAGAALVKKKVTDAAKPQGSVPAYLMSGANPLAQV